MFFATLQWRLLTDIVIIIMSNIQEDVMALETRATPISIFIEGRLKELDLNYRDVALMTGFSNEHAVYLMMRGEAKVPIDCVPALAEVLCSDAAGLLDLALRQFVPSELLEDLRRLNPDAAQAPNVQARIGSLQHASDQADAGATSEGIARLRPAVPCRPRFTPEND
ncbi:hypothetical protein ACVDG8_001780 [Mesorhizobium sp. ORM8.1]